MTFSLLVVCTGNICRSPLAERLLLARLRPDAPVRVSSAGTGALVGHSMDVPSALCLRELGGDPDGHAARQLTAGLIAGADLVLTAQQEHRDAVRTLDPAAADRAFTLREFGRLAAELPGRPGVDAPGLRSRVAAVAALRRPAPRRVDDIGDPFGAALPQVHACAAQVGEAVDAVLAGLGLDRRREATA